MQTEILVPTLANAGVRLAIARWFKRPGDPIKFEKPLVEIDADKMSHEVRSPVTGALSKSLV
jgi:2-oxoglutarate dehydrogenase E2 component (dihydrolipoamide succinyltransferase)